MAELNASVLSALPWCASAAAFAAFTSASPPASCSHVLKLFSMVVGLLFLVL